MEISQNSLNEFVNSLPEKVRKERDLIIKSDLKAEDTAVRKEFGRTLERWFCQHFELEDSKGYVFVEGLNRIPNNLRGATFFGSKMYPDVALIMPGEQLKIAIELDHGSKGSQIRNALAKASFSVTLGGYNRALVFFFVDSPKLVSPLHKGSAEEEILKIYQSQFNTTLYLL